jgi:hypothetical protein
MNKLTLTLLGVIVLTAVGAAADDPKPLKPTNLAINTKDDEDEPHVSSNGLILFYSTKLKVKDKGKTEEREKITLLHSTRTAATRPWGAGKAFEDFFGYEYDVRGVFLTPEGVFPQVMYFGHFVAPDMEKGTTGNWDVSFAVRERAGKGFGPTRPLNTIATSLDEAHPWLTPGAKQFYFSRKKEGVWRVYVANRTNTTGVPAFGDPVEIKELPDNFHHATLTPDGKTMYLQGPLGKDRWGLFVSTRGNTGWSKPEPLDQLNHPDGKTGDRSPSLSRDGSLLYFVSDRPEGKGGLDIWVIPTKDLAKKK